MSHSANTELGLFIQGIVLSKRSSIVEKTQLFGHVAPWSPDGRQIVFDAQTSASARQATLYMANADGSGLRRRSTAADQGPSATAIRPRPLRGRRSRSTVE
jgi:Tol biopolymer transport system component